MFHPCWFCTNLASIFDTRWRVCLSFHINHRYMSVTLALVFWVWCEMIKITGDFEITNVYHLVPNIYSDNNEQHEMRYEKKEKFIAVLPICHIWRKTRHIYRTRAKVYFSRRTFSCPIFGKFQRYVFTVYKILPMGLPIERVHPFRPNDNKN